MVRRAARRSEMQVMFAVRMRLGQSRSGPASTCIEDLRVRTSSVAARSTRPPRSYRVRHQSWELWLPPQERRGLCQAPDTRMWLNAQKVDALNLPTLPVGQHLDSHMGLGIGILLEVSLHNK